MIPTHNKIRDFDLVMSITEQYETIITNPICVMVTEDGKEWIRDGHHRAAALWLVYGFIPEQYVKYEVLDYIKINEINLSVGWMTPFDPRTTCRLPSFGYYKETIKFVKERHGEEHAESFIRLYPFMYSEPRKINSIEELLVR